MPAILDQYGKPFTRQRSRRELVDEFVRGRAARRAQLRYDAAATTTEFERIWANTDSRDADSANDPSVRQKLRDRSRYEAGSNAIYSGILRTYCNMMVGTGPTLRMLTGNRTFNETVERAWYEWCKAVQFRRKLWCMVHALLQDGEAFALIQNNPDLSIPRNNNVQLDFMPIEAEQVQTPYLPFRERGYIDGIRFDDFGNILWYDVLPSHPGGNNVGNFDRPIRVAPSQMIHWFKLERPDSHRGVPTGTASLNTGAAGRRFREATIGAAEVAAEFTVMLESELTASDEAVVEPSILDIEKRMMTALPRGTKAKQMAAEHPNAQYEQFNRAIISEEARPFSMPYNAAACDSSTYSFASGKLDMLCFWSEMDVARCDGNDLALDMLFASWFREWTILRSLRNIPPDHQWDWPPKPTIDAVAEAQANDVRLKNGTLTLRQAYSDQGMDFEDQLRVMAADYFGESEDMEESITMMRQILLATHYPIAAQMLMPQSEDVGEQEEDRYVA